MLKRYLSLTLVLAAVLTAGCGTATKAPTTAPSTSCVPDAVLAPNPLYAGCAQSIHNHIADRLAATAKR